jgi:hypothetical protein
MQINTKTTVNSASIYELPAMLDRTRLLQIFGLTDHRQFTIRHNNRTSLK